MKLRMEYNTYNETENEGYKKRTHGRYNKKRSIGDLYSSKL